MGLGCRKDLGFGSVTSRLGALVHLMPPASLTWESPALMCKAAQLDPGFPGPGSLAALELRVGIWGQSQLLHEQKQIGCVVL